MTRNSPCGLLKNLIQQHPCALLFAVLLGTSACSPRTPSSAPKPENRPNVIWVVWDTVRADRMSLYGYSKPTTPKLEAWSAQARVFDNCISTAGSTVPSHASMFTGLLPSEHDTNNDHQFLLDEYLTIAELLVQSGYRTYLFAANPHISSDENFNQGFEIEEHPWSPKYKTEALKIVQSKVVPQDKTSELSKRIRNSKQGKANPWDIKAAGELAQRGALDWLATGASSKKPFFIFLNYMEAHRPFLPPENYRRLMMTPQQVEQSYLIDRSWLTMWSYCFGLHSYSNEELSVMAGTYDATLAELDDLFASLMAAMDQGGHLENTIVILTADHGEHLGEHHMLDHQYGLYQPLLNVPLVLYYPAKVQPGRDSRPVANFDIFPTLLELCSVPPPALNSKAVSLLSPQADRVRLAEYPAIFNKPIRDVRKKHPDLDASSWQRTLRAVFDGPEKLIWGSDGKHELFDLAADPGELQNLMESRSTSATRLNGLLSNKVSELAKPLPRGGAKPEPRSEEQNERLRGLGYAGDEDEEGSDEADKQPL